MNTFPEFRTWVVRMIMGEFERQVQQSDLVKVRNDRTQLVRMRLCVTSKEVCLPLRTLEGASVLLSVWEDQTEIDRALSDTLLANLFQSSSERNGDATAGLASAVILTATTTTATSPKVPIEMVSSGHSNRIGAKALMRFIISVDHAGKGKEHYHRKTCGPFCANDLPSTSSAVNWFASSIAHCYDRPSWLSRGCQY